MVFNQLRLDLQKAPKMLEFFFLFLFFKSFCCRPKPFVGHFTSSRPSY